MSLHLADVLLITVRPFFVLYALRVFGPTFTLVLSSLLAPSPFLYGCSHALVYWQLKAPQNSFILGCNSKSSLLLQAFCSWLFHGETHCWELIYCFLGANATDSTSWRSRNAKMASWQPLWRATSLVCFSVICLCRIVQLAMRSKDPQRMSCN